MAALKTCAADLGLETLTIAAYHGWWEQHRNMPREDKIADLYGGSFTAATEAAGVAEPPPASLEDVHEWMQQIVTALGHPPTKVEWNQWRRDHPELGMIVADMVGKRFGWLTVRDRYG